MPRAVVIVSLLTLAMPAGPARADDALFRAMSMIAMGSGMPETLPQVEQDGNLYDITSMGSSAGANLLSPGPDACSVIHTSVTQDRGGWAQISVKTYDFRKVTAARYLADADDYLKAPSRQPDDPQVGMIVLDGKAWNCQRVLHVDPSKPSFGQYCDDTWTVTVIGDQDRNGARAAIDRIAPQCFAR